MNKFKLLKFLSLGWNTREIQVKFTGILQPIGYFSSKVVVLAILSIFTSINSITIINQNYLAL